MSDFSEVSNSMTNNSVNTLSLKHLPISHSCMLKRGCKCYAVPFMGNLIGFKA